MKKTAHKKDGVISDVISHLMVENLKIKSKTKLKEEQYD